MELLIGEYIKSYTRLKSKDLTRHLSPWVRFQLDSAQAHVKKTKGHYLKSSDGSDSCNSEGSQAKQSSPK